MLAVIGRRVWLFWPGSVAGMSRAGRYLPYGVTVLGRIGRDLMSEVVVLARAGGRAEQDWPLFAV